MLTLEEVKKIVEEIESREDIKDENVYCLECGNHIMPGCIGENYEGKRVCPVCGSKYIVPSKEYKSFSKDDLKGIEVYISSSDPELYYLMYQFNTYFSLEKKGQKYWNYLDKVCVQLEEKGEFMYVNEHICIAFANKNYDRMRELYNLAYKNGIMSIYDIPESFFYADVLSDKELFEYLSISASLGNNFASSKIHQCLALGKGVKKNYLLAYKLSVRDLRSKVLFLDNYDYVEDELKDIYDILITLLQSIYGLCHKTNKDEYFPYLFYYRAMANYLADELGEDRIDDEYPLTKHYIDFLSLTIANDIYDFSFSGRVYDFVYDESKKRVIFKITFDSKLLLANGINNSCKYKKTFDFIDDCSSVYNYEGARKGFRFDFIFVDDDEIKFFKDDTIITSINFD